MDCFDILIEQIEKDNKPFYDKLERVAYHNQEKVLKAFQDNHIALNHFNGTTGYGYDDIGREKLCKLFAQIFGTEDAIVSPLIVNGTHALSTMLFGISKQNDTILSITGKPYDTLDIAINGDNIGSLKDYGVKFECIDLRQNGEFDIIKIQECIKKLNPNIIYIQRSRGYNMRDSLSPEHIDKIIKFIRQQTNNVIIAIDNCYGEFVDYLEPTDMGADIMAGSLIKNPGGGIAPTGGYIVGNKQLIERVAARLTVPGVGMEVGSYNTSYQYFFQGLFLAPHTVLQAMKASVLFSAMFSKLGLRTLPSAGKLGNDIITSIEFHNKEDLIKFIQTIQKCSPVDSHVVPYPWAMPGYEDEVIMAAGSFVQGSSIELSADAPIKSPYVAYLQGSLTYEHAKIALKQCLVELFQDEVKHLIEKDRYDYDDYEEQEKYFNKPFVENKMNEDYFFGNVEFEKDSFM